MWVLLTVLFGLARVFDHLIPDGLAIDSFKALAHIFVGCLFGAGFFAENKWFYLRLAIGLSLLELVCFLYDKFV